jgi:hypothetical protein
LSNQTLVVVNDTDDCTENGWNVPAEESGTRRGEENSGWLVHNTAVDKARSTALLHGERRGWTYETSLFSPPSSSSTHLFVAGLLNLPLNPWTGLLVKLGFTGFREIRGNAILCGAPDRNGRDTSPPDSTLESVIYYYTHTVGTTQQAKSSSSSSSSSDGNDDDESSSCSPSTYDDSDGDDTYDDGGSSSSECK